MTATKKTPAADRLFCYGSLQVAEVICEVIGRTPSGQPATLPDYRPFRIKGATYPGIALTEGAKTPGVVLCDLTENEFARLDAVEGEPYERKLKQVRISSGSSVAAWVYLLPADKLNCLSEEVWDLAAFRRNDLGEFMRRCLGIPAEGEAE